MEKNVNVEKKEPELTKRQRIVNLVFTIIQIVLIVICVTASIFIIANPGGYAEDPADCNTNIMVVMSDSMEPTIRPNILVLDFEGKNIVAVKVDEILQNKKPCYYKPKGLHNGAYTRIGDRDDHMTEYEIYKCISYRENVKDDLKAVTRATIKDLDENLLNKFIVNAKIDKPKFAEFSDEEILLQYGVLTQVEDKIFPTVAGVMVFGIYPQRFFPQWFVAAIVIPGFEVANLGEVGQRFDDNKNIILTPDHIKSLMVKLARLNVDDVVLDTCTGSGGFLMESMETMIKMANGNIDKIEEIKETLAEKFEKIKNYLVQIGKNFTNKEVRG